jgi:hypothetical protein
MAKDAYDRTADLVQDALIDGVLNAAREGVADIVKEYSDEKTKMAKIVKVRDAAARFMFLIEGMMADFDSEEVDDASADNEHDPAKS